MKKQANRKAILISALLTILILAGATSVAISAGQLSAAEPQQAPVLPANPQIAQPETTIATDGEVLAAYQAQLQLAYQALNEAYAQINALQRAQAQAPQPRWLHDDDEHEGGFVVSGTRFFPLQGSNDD